jgi:chemotaxis protein MotB
MAFTSRRQRRSSIDIWPGFVDALSQLVMVIIFVLLVFTAGQFYLSAALSGRETELSKAQEKLNSLAALLLDERKAGEKLAKDFRSLSLQLQAANADRDKLAGQIAALTNKADDTAAAARATAAEQQARLAQTQQDLASRDIKLGSAQTTIDQLNLQILALRQQLAQIAAALDVSEAKAKEQQVQIANLGQRLNAALASKVEELARYRSEFFGRLREVLGDRPDIRIVGDRFVFQSEVLFGPASAELSDDAKQQLQPVAQALKDIAAKIPPDLNWVLRVDGHTDKRPISTPVYPSNWELSTGRAISVVRFFIDQGISATHLVAAGFGEFQPLDAGGDEAAYRRNRRIELKLTER